MIFLIFFIIGGLVIPLLLDIEKHGSDSILHRSGRDILDYKITKNTMHFFHISKRKVGSLFAIILFIVVLLFLFYIAIKFIVIISFLLGLFVR